MIDDDSSLDSGNASFDTSAALRPGSINHGLHEVNSPGCGEMSNRGSINNHRYIGSVNEASSLETTRQDELRRQAVTNALNQFIVQAGNIYKGNRLSAVDADRLRKAATDAGLSVKVVDALLKQTTDKNSMLGYCATSDDVFARKIKEDPQLSHVLLQKDQESRVDGLNVSNSVWRIFLHKIIKQFLKEQNMQLGDIIGKSLETRQLYEDALRCDPKENIKFDTSSPRDYSEERKRVFISKDDAKLARLKASEAMIKFQESQNISAYDLVNGTSIQRPRELRTPIKQNELDSPDSRDDIVSIVPCATDRELSFHRMKDQSAAGNKRFSEDDDLRISPFFAECGDSSIHKIEEFQQENNDVSKTLSPKSVQTEASPAPREDHSKNDSADPRSLVGQLERGSQLSPSTEELLPDKNTLRTSLSSPEQNVPPPPRAIIENTSPSKMAGRTNVSTAVKQRMAVFENSVRPSQTKQASSKQNALPFGSVLQTRAIFEKQDEQIPLTPEPNRKRQNTNIQGVLATWTQKEQEKTLSSEYGAENKDITASSTKIKMQTLAMFEKQDQQMPLTPNPNRKRQNTNIQGVLATWTQKEQEKTLSSERGAENKDITASSTKIKMQTLAMFEKQDQQMPLTPNPNRKRQNTNIQDVLTTWTQKEQGKTLSSEYGAKNKDITASSSTRIKIQTLAMFEKQDQQKPLTPNLNRKRENANIQEVLTTWTQKEQENSMPPEHYAQNKTITKSGIKVKMRNKLKKVPGKMQDHDNTEEISLNGGNKVKKIQNIDSVLGDQTSSFQNGSTREETKAVKLNGVDTEGSLLWGTHQKEVKVNQNSRSRTTKIGLDEVDAHYEMKKQDQSKIYEMKQSCSESLSKSTQFSSSQNIESCSADFKEITNQPTCTSPTIIKMASDVSRQLHDKVQSNHVEDCFIEADTKFYDELAYIRRKSEDSSTSQHNSDLTEKPKSRHIQSEKDRKEMFEEHKCSPSLHFSGNVMGQKRHAVSPLSIIVAESNEVINLSPFGSNFFNNGKNESDERNIMLNGRVHIDQTQISRNEMTKQQKHSSSVKFIGNSTGPSRLGSSPLNIIVAESDEVIKLSPFGSSFVRKGRNDFVDNRMVEVDEELHDHLGYVNSNSDDSSTTLHDRVNSGSLLEPGKLHGHSLITSHDEMANKPKQMPKQEKYSSSVNFRGNPLSQNHQRSSPFNIPVSERDEVIRAAPFGNNFFKNDKNHVFDDHMADVDEEPKDNHSYNKNKSDDSSTSLQNKTYSDQTENPRRSHYRSQASHIDIPREDEYLSSANFSGNPLSQNHQRSSPLNMPVTETNKVVKLSPFGNNFSKNGKKYYFEDQNYDLDCNNIKCGDSSMALHDRVYSDQTGKLGKGNVQPQTDYREMFKEEKCPTSVNSSGNTLGQNHKRYISLNAVIAETNEVVKLSPFGSNFFKKNKNDFIEEQNNNAHDEFDDKVSFIRSKSDDSNLIPAPPSGTPEKMNSIRQKTNKITSSIEPSQHSHHSMDNVPTSTNIHNDEASEFPNQNTWFGFHSNNMFREQSQKHSQKQGQSSHKDKTKTTKTFDVSSKRVHLAEISNSFASSDKSANKNTWTDFESDYTFREEHQERFHARENPIIINIVEDLKQNDSMAPKLIECTKTPSNDRSDKKLRVKFPEVQNNERKRGGMHVSTENNAVGEHPYSSFEKAPEIDDWDVAIPNVAAIETSQQKIDHETKDKSYRGSALATSSKNNLIAVDMNSEEKNALHELTSFANEFDGLEQEEGMCHQRELVEENHEIERQARSRPPNEARYCDNLIEEETYPSHPEQAYFEKLLQSKTPSSSSDSSSSSSGIHLSAPNIVKEDLSHKTNSEQSTVSQHSKAMTNEANFEGKNDRNPFEEQFGSNFNDAGGIPPNEYIPQMARNDKEGKGFENEKCLINHSTLCSEDTQDVLVKPTAAREDFGNFGATDIHFMTRSSDSGESSTTASIEAENRYTERLSHEDNRERPENELQSRIKNVVLGEDLETDLRNPDMDTSSGNSFSCEERLRSRSNVHAHGSIWNNNDHGLRTNQIMPLESPTVEDLEKNANCVTLDENDSVLEHHHGIRDFLEQRGDLSEGHVKPSPQLDERTDDIGRKDELSEQRDHFEALNAFLAEYELGGKQPKSKRLEAPRCDDDDTEEHHDKFEDLLGEYHRDVENDYTEKQPALLHPNLDEKYADEIDHCELRHSQEISWPTSEAEHKEIESGTFHNPVGVGIIPNSIDRRDDDSQDFKTPHENNLVHANIHGSPKQYSENVTHAVRYDSRTREVESTGHSIYPNQNLYQPDQLHPFPVVRILDRPLLDLDDDDEEEEYLDAIEVERQNTYNSQELEGTLYSSDRQTYRMDPPDPVPAGRYPEGRRLSTNYTGDAPEGATREEIELLNRFIDVASTDFGGQVLSAESEARVRAAALKVGLTSKFVDQLLNQTMKPPESEDPDFTFVASSEHQQHQQQHQQPPQYDGQNGYHKSHAPYPHRYEGDYGGENETYYTAEYSRSNTKQGGRRACEDCNFNIWDNLGKGLTHLANITAKTCGVNYHRSDRDRDRDRYREDRDGDSIVSAISWDGDHGKSSSSARRAGRSGRRPREVESRVAAEDGPSTNINYEHQNVHEHEHEHAYQHQHERTRHVTFDDNIDELEYHMSGLVGMDAVRDSTPPREKITQLV
eukprot:jgi/Psemu1/48133/gm1.48133_g